MGQPDGAESCEARFPLVVTTSIPAKVELSGARRDRSSEVASSRGRPRPSNRSRWWRRRAQAQPVIAGEARDHRAPVGHIVISIEHRSTRFVAKRWPTRLATRGVAMLDAP